MKYTINVPSTPEKEDNFVVIIIDDKKHTQTAFALSKTEKSAGQLRIIKTAIAKMKFLGDNSIKEIEEKKTKELKKVLKKVSKKKIKDIK